MMGEIEHASHTEIRALPIEEAQLPGGERLHVDGWAPVHFWAKGRQQQLLVSAMMTDLWCFPDQYLIGILSTRMPYLETYDGLSNKPNTAGQRGRGDNLDHLARVAECGRRVSGCRRDVI